MLEYYAVEIYIFKTCVLRSYFKLLFIICLPVFLFCLYVLVNFDSYATSGLRYESVFNRDLGFLASFVFRDPTSFRMNGRKGLDWDRDRRLRRMKRCFEQRWMENRCL